MMNATRRALLGGGAATVAGLACAAALHGGREARAASAGIADGAVFPVHRTNAEWRRLLTPARYDVLRNAGTEWPFSSPLDHLWARGTYHCAGCDHAVFPSDTKFDSGTGWPSFYRPLPDAVLTRTDTTLGMTRTEVHCATCGGHLGHRFPDGPPPTGLRYCINGTALLFKPTGA